MSSGSLPFATYHRASHLGSGTFGSVVTVYNEDGEEYALKLFLDDDDDDDDDDDEDVGKPMGLGTLREISCLRLLRGHHPNVVKMIDIQPEWSENEESGAGTSGCIGMALPLYKNGSLADAIDRKTFQAYPKRAKVELAHGILSAVSFIHDNGIVHRDIKSDNILLESNDENDYAWKPILIDFSLAKPLNEAIWSDTPSEFVVEDNSEEENVEHTGEVGTIVYTAPEIVDGEPYGLSSDLYSVGVVLLELLINKTFTAVKYKEAFQQIKEAVETLPTDAPFPNLVRSLLRHDPQERPTARQALEHPLFIEKFKLIVRPTQYVNVAIALPYDDNDTENDEKHPIFNDATNKKPSSNGTRKLKIDPKIDKRMKYITKVCTELESNNPWTKSAALEYSMLLEQLDEDIDNPDKSQGLLDCIVLAHRFFELEMIALHDLSEEYKRFEDWSYQDYIDNESSIFMMMDYCLYPRKLIKF